MINIIKEDACAHESVVFQYYNSLYTEVVFIHGQGMVGRLLTTGKVLYGGIPIDNQSYLFDTFIEKLYVELWKFIK
jgi:hypothetical protein